VVPQVLFGTPWLVALTAISIRAGHVATGSRADDTKRLRGQEQALRDSRKATSPASPEPEAAAKTQANGTTADLGIADQATHEALQILARSAATAPNQFGARTLGIDQAAAVVRTASPATQNGAAFWDVWLRHQDHLLRQCLRIMSGNVADAEDALSSAMMRASTRYEVYADEIINERAWLSRLVRNCCIDHFRAVQRRHRLLERHAPGRTGGQRTELQAVPPAGATLQPSPEQNAIDRSLLSRLAEDMRRLPEHLRRPLMMRFLQDKSYAEIAETLSLTNATVRKRIQLARQRLRKTRS
jgi:RNA polymerase sigma factor (sigma-70 family)